MCINTVLDTCIKVAWTNKLKLKKSRLSGAIGWDACHNLKRNLVFSLIWVLKTLFLAKIEPKFETSKIKKYLEIIYKY